MASPQFQVQRTAVAANGPGLGFSVPDAATRATPLYKLTAILSAIPAAKRKFLVCPEQVTTQTASGLTTVNGWRNILGSQRGIEGAPFTLRDPAAAQSRQGVVAAFANGAPGIRLPQSGTVAEPVSCPVTLNPDAHTLFGIARLTSGTVGDIVGLVTPVSGALGGIGVHLRKEASNHFLTWYFNGTTGLIRHSTSILNKTIFWMLVYDRLVGRRLYVNGVMVAEDLSDAGKAPPTVLDIQFFATSRTGTGTASGLHGPQCMVDVALFDPAYADVLAALNAHMAANYPLGA